MKDGEDMYEPDGALRVRLEASNIPAKHWEKYGPIIQAGCEHGGFRPIDLDTYSLGDLYKLPDNSPPCHTTQYIIGVLQGMAIVLIREKGLLSKKVDFKAINLPELPALSWYPEDAEKGRGWGAAELQGVTGGGQPMFRFSWGWSHDNPDMQLVTAVRERDRIRDLLSA